ncbi:gluconolactonase [Allostella sp. ATCC 35155]|nr:gluconolactonase [Stella sp. ATCC 35155]
MTAGRRAAASGAADASGLRCAVEAGDLLGETPIWCPRTRALWWIDIERPCLHRFDPATAEHRARPVQATWLGSLALRRAGGFLVATGSSLAALDPDTGRLAHFAAIEDEAIGNRLNDGRADAAGRFWIGSMDLALHRPQAAFYCVHPDGRVVRQHDGVIVTNTVAITPDQRTLYVSDTRRFVVWAYDLDAEAGTLSRRRVHIDHTATGDRPDGACVDADGCLWIAMFGGGRIVRHAPDGRVDRVIPLPVTNPTCLAFGGDDYRTLYVTTARKFLGDATLAVEPWAGALLALEPGPRGLPEAMFAG